LDVLGLDGKTPFNRLKQPAQRATWSHFKNLAKHLEWVDGLGDSAVWLEGVASGKVTDFAGEAAAADAGVLRDYTPMKRAAPIACLVHKARMRVRDDLTTMFTKRIATKVKKAKEELEEIRKNQQAMVEALVGNYRTLLQQVDDGGPAQNAQARAAAMIGEVLGLSRTWTKRRTQPRPPAAWTGRSRPRCWPWPRRCAFRPAGSAR